MLGVIIAEKQEMTQLFDSESKKAVPCTVLKVAKLVVVGLKTEEKDGYKAVVLGYGKKRNSTKPEQGIFKALGYVPAVVKEIRVGEMPEVSVGDEITVSDYELGENVRIQGVGKGKGFQGVVKRYHFKGGPVTHGQSDRTRAPGSIGMRSTPGRVFKGKRMPGRMGNETVSLESKIVKVDSENRLMVVKGAVPGGRNSVLVITKK